MARAEASRKWLNIVGRVVQTSSSSSLSAAIHHYDFIQRKQLVLPWISVMQKPFCTSNKREWTENKRVNSVSAREAHQLHQAGHSYLDVRTHEEFEGGHTIGAINIPYMHMVGSEMKKNPRFLDEVSSSFSKCDKIIVGCRSGKRSLMAATDLFSAGYSGVSDVAGGFEAWTLNGFPIHN